MAILTSRARKLRSSAQPTGALDAVRTFLPASAVTRPRDPATPVLTQRGGDEDRRESPPRLVPIVAPDRPSALGRTAGTVPPQLARPGAVRRRSVPTMPARAARPRSTRHAHPHRARALHDCASPLAHSRVVSVARSRLSVFRPFVLCPSVRASRCATSQAYSAGAAAGSAHALGSGALVSCCRTPVGARQADQSPRSGRRASRQARPPWAGFEPPRSRECPGSDRDPGADRRTADRRSAASVREWPAGPGRPNPAFSPASRRRVPEEAVPDSPACAVDSASEWAHTA